MKHTKKFISMLLIVCMLGLTVFSDIGALGTDATVSAADETTAMKELTFADFGIADGEYSAAPYSQTNINALKHCNQNTAFKNTVFSGNFLFPTPDSGARTQSSRVIFGSKNAWEGFYFSVNPAGSIMQFYISSVVESGADDTGFFIRTDQGTHNNWIGSFVDKEFKLEISFEALDYDGDGSEDDAKVKVYINDRQCELFRSDNSTFYDEWYIQGAYSKGNLTNNIYFQNTNADNTIQISSVKTEKKLREVSFKDVGFADGYHGSKTLNYAYSLKDTVVSSKVTLSDGAYFMYGSTSWNTFIVQKTAAGTFKMYKNGSGPTLLGDTATIYAYETDFENLDFESQFTLSVTTEAYDCDGDGVADDAKVGFWADGNLLGNRYFGFQDQFVDGKTMNGFYVYYVTFESTPYTLSGQLRELTLADFGLESGIYSSSAIAGPFGSKKPSTLMDTVLTMDVEVSGEESWIQYASNRSYYWDGLCLQFNSNGNLYAQFWKQSDESVWRSQETITPEDAGLTSFRDNKFSLSISLERCSLDLDHADNDIQVGIWFNGKLAKGQYLFVKDHADNVPNGMGLFTSRWSNGEATIKLNYEPDPVLSEELTQLTLEDFGVASGVHSSSKVAGAYGTKKPATLLDTVFTVDVEASGEEAWIQYASTRSAYYWDGLMLRFNTSDVIYVDFWEQSDGSEWHPQATITPEDAGLTTFRNQKFKLQISLERWDADKDGANNDVRVGLWFNGKLAKKTYYYIKDKADSVPTGMGVFTSRWSNGESTLKLDYVAPEVLSERLRKLTLNDFGMATGEYYSSGSIGGPFGSKKPSSLLNTVLSLDVEVSGTESWIQYASKRSYYWDGLCLQFNTNGNVYVQFWQQSADTVWHPQETITPADAGLTSFRDEKFRLDISLERWDVDEDGENNDVRVGLWFNGKLAKNQYYYIKDQASNVPTGMGLFTSRWSNGEAKIKLASATQTHETFDILTLESFGMTPAVCGVGTANNPYHVGVSRSNTVETLDDKIFSTNVRFNSYDSDIYYARRNSNNWDALRIGNVTDNESKGNDKARCFRLTNSNGTIARTFDEGIAGTRLSNDTFNLKISTRNVDSDGDGAFDDLELGVWFNDKLYSNTYMYYANMADVYTPYVGTYCNTDRGEVVLGDIVQTEATPITYCADKFAYFVDGDTVTVDGTDCGASKTLSAPGVYDVTYTDLDSTYMEKVTVYKTNDITENGDVDVRDLVALKMYVADRRQINAAGEQAIGAGQGFDGATAYDKMVEHLLGDSNVIGAKEFSEELVGTQTGAGTYVAAVDTTEEGTSVMSFTETQTDNYKSNADTFDGMGLDYVLDFATDRDIKVLQITDTQLVDSTQDTTNLTAEKIEDYKPTDENKAKLLYNELDQLVAETKPDVILLTGDIVWGTYDDAGTLFEDIVAHMDSYKIPWAPIMGNHDQETAKGTAWICDLLRSAEYSIFTRNNELGGNGNYSIGIAKNGELERTIFMMDSSGIYGASKEEIQSGEANYVYMLHEGQIAWYRTIADRTKVKSFVCMHANSADFMTALQEKGYQSMMDNDYNKAYYDLGMDNTQEDFGFKYEAKTGGMQTKEYLYPYFQAAGTDGVFIGHDHSISLSIKWKDIRWTWGLKTGRYASYWEKTGGTLITLDGSDFVVEHKVITDTSVAQ